MENLSTWTELLYHTFSEFGQRIASGLPSLIGAILILLFGWIFAKIISGLVQRLLNVIKFNTLADNIKVQDFLTKANIKLEPSVIIGKFIFWIIMLLVVITSSETLGWTALSDEVSKLIAYLPQLLAAVVFLIIGIYIATFVRDVLSSATRTLGISSGKIISAIVFYLLIIIVVLTSLKQAGIDTSIITSNLLVIIGSVMLAAAISYGFASRDVLSNILGSFFSRRTYAVGQNIEIDGKRGQISNITNVSVTIRLDDHQDLVIPAHQFMTKQIIINRK